MDDEYGRNGQHGQILVFCPCRPLRPCRPLKKVWENDKPDSVIEQSFI